jgi:hypothetical protein
MRFPFLLGFRNYHPKGSPKLNQESKAEASKGSSGEGEGSGGSGRGYLSSS